MGKILGIKNVRSSFCTLKTIFTLDPLLKCEKHEAQVILDGLDRTLLIRWEKEIKISAVTLYSSAQEMLCLM